MTVSIAIFHGKCHLIHRHDFLAGIELPFKKTVEEYRDHYYGWSFVLAWICVVLCFVHTWVWLAKAQDMPDLCLPGRRRWMRRFFKVKRKRRKRKKFHLPSTAEKLRKLGERNKNFKRRDSLTRWATNRHINIHDFTLIPQKIGLGDQDDSSFPQDENHYCSIPFATRAVENHIGQPPINRNRRWSDGATRGPSLAQRAKLEAAAMNGVSVGNIYRNHIDACSLKKCTSGEYYKVLQRPRSEFKILVQPTEFKMYKQPCDCDYTAWKYPSESKLLSQRFADSYKMINTAKSHPNITSANSHSNIKIKGTQSHPNITTTNSHSNMMGTRSHTNINSTDSQSNMSIQNSQPNITSINSNSNISIPNSYPNINNPNSHPDIESTNNHSYMNIATSHPSIDNINNEPTINSTNNHLVVNSATASNHVDVDSTVIQTNIDSVNSHSNVSIPNSHSRLYPL